MAHAPTISLLFITLGSGRALDELRTARKDVHMRFIRLRRERAVDDAGDPPLVLVADDDELIQRLLGRALERKGYRVHVCGDGKEALAVATKAPPAVAVLDWMMPGLQGPDVCAYLKGAPATSKVRVILLTSRGVDAEIESAFERGADDYMTKPFNVDELVRLVERQIDMTAA